MLRTREIAERGGRFEVSSNRLLESYREYVRTVFKLRPSVIGANFLL